MSEEQRQFIYSLLDHDVEWKKLDLIKALLIFNKCKELNIDIDKSNSNILFNYIDDQNQKRINNLIYQFDKLYLIEN